MCTLQLEICKVAAQSLLAVRLIDQKWANEGKVALLLRNPWLTELYV
jgi:hypothetical protein